MATIVVTLAIFAKVSMVDLIQVYPFPVVANICCPKLQKTRSVKLHQDTVFMVATLELVNNQV